MYSILGGGKSLGERKLRLPVAFPWWPRHINRRKVSKFHENSQIEVEGRRAMVLAGGEVLRLWVALGHAGPPPRRVGARRWMYVERGASRSLPGFAPLLRSLPGFAPLPNSLIVPVGGAG